MVLYDIFKVRPQLGDEERLAVSLKTENLKTLAVSLLVVTEVSLYNKYVAAITQLSL